MTKKSFYITLNIMNVLFFAYMYVMIVVCYIVFSIDNAWIASNCLILSIIFIKIFLLYILFTIFTKYFPNSILSKIAKELKSNKIARKESLLLAFTYDVVIISICIVYFMFLYSNFELLYSVAYEILTVGGVLMFYLSTFCLWKIEDKIKDFYNKKLLNNKSK